MTAGRAAVHVPAAGPRGRVRRYRYDALRSSDLSDAPRRIASTEPGTDARSIRSKSIPRTAVHMMLQGGAMNDRKKPRAVGFNHVALEVADIEEALAFYGRLFAFELRSKSDSMAFIDLGDQFLALQKGRTQPAD